MATNQEASITIRAYDKASYAVLGVAANLETLNKRMTRTSQLGYAFGQVGKQLAPAWNRMSELGDKWGAAFRRISMAGLAVGGATAGMVGFAKHTADVGDHVNDLSNRFKVGGDEIQLYGKLIAESGGTFDDAAFALGKLKKAMNEAIHNDKSDEAAAFAGIGVSIAELKKMKAEELLLKMADAFKGSDKDLAKNTVLLKLMGKSGSIFMETMDRGGAKIIAKFAEMKRNGEILNKQQLADSDAFSNSWDRMAGTFDGLKNKLGIQLATRLTPLLDKFQVWLSGAGGKRLAEEFDRIFTSENIQAFAGTLLAIGRVIVKLGQGFKYLVDTFGPTNVILAGLAIVLAPVGAALLSTAGALFSVGRAVVGIAGAIPGLGAGLATVAGTLARIAPLAAAAFAGWAIGGAINDKISQKIQQSTGGESSSLGDYVYNRTHNQDLGSKEFGQFSWRKAITGQEQNIKNTIDIKIDADGRAKVTDMKSGSANTTLNASTGLIMAGG